MPLCDTIYTYVPGSKLISPRYVVQTPRMATRNQIRENTPSYGGDLYELSKHGYFTGFNGIYETDSKILLKYMQGVTIGYFLFDKETQKGNHYLYVTNANTKTLPFNVVYHSYGNKFVSVMKAGDLLSLTDISDNHINEVISSLNEEDNPCLVLYEMK